jgi:broad specificity phosphatase PhoE
VTRILLARHGEAAYESELMTDDGGCLTAEGRAQAGELGEAARVAGVHAVWCSPLSRAVQTAEIAAAVAGVRDVTVREDLREYSVGDHRGRPAGDEPSLLLPVFESWEAGDDRVAIPGGERISAIVGRVSRVLEDVATEAGGGAALVVSHGGAIMTTVPVLTGRPREEARTLTLAGGGHVTLTRSEAGWSLAR